MVCVVYDSLSACLRAGEYASKRVYGLTLPQHSRLPHHFGNAPLLNRLERLVRVLSALLTPTIGGITTYIAVQQYKTNRSQYRLALFAKRLAVFDSTMNFIAAVLRDANVELQQLYALMRETREHDLLFGPEIGQYINDELYTKGLELHTRTMVGWTGKHRASSHTLGMVQSPGQGCYREFFKYIDFRGTLR
jgi:hypothetical protein